MHQHLGSWQSLQHQPPRLSHQQESMVSPSCQTEHVQSTMYPIKVWKNIYCVYMSNYYELSLVARNECNLIHLLQRSTLVEIFSTPILIYYISKVSIVLQPFSLTKPQRSEWCSTTTCFHSVPPFFVWICYVLLLLPGPVEDPLTAARAFDHQSLRGETLLPQATKCTSLEEGVAHWCAHDRVWHARSKLKKMRKKGAQSAKCKVLDSSCIILQSTWPHVAKLSHWPESLYAHQSNLVWVLPVLTSPSSWVPLSLQCNQSNYVKVTFRKPEKRILKCGKSKMGQACESNDLPTCLPFKTAWGTFWFEWESHLNPRVPSQKPKSLFSNFDVQQSQGIPPMTHILKHQKFQLTGIVNTFLCRLQNSVLGILTAPSTTKMQLQKK